MDIETLTTPTSLVLYAVPLALIVATTLVRAAVMSWRLLGVARQRMPVERVLDGSMSAEQLARAALANRVSTDSLTEDLLARLRSRSRAELDAAVRTLRAADVRFDYLWARMNIRLSSTWNWMRLTLLAAGLITTSLFFDRLESASYGLRTRIDTIAGLQRPMYETVVWAMAQLALGFAVAGVLCIVALVFDGMLQRRLTSWKYFYASARDALSDAQSGSSSTR